jgi:hypothetical protein
MLSCRLFRNGSKVLTTVTVNITVFLKVMCNWQMGTTVPEEPTAFIFRAVTGDNRFLRNVNTLFYQSAWRHVTDDHNLKTIVVKKKRPKIAFEQK